MTPDEPSGEPGLFQAIASQRAIRLFKPDPLPDEALARILKAATHAPSSYNTQPWQFVLVRDAALRRRLGELYQEAERELLGGAPPVPSPIDEAPLLVLVCRRTHDQPPEPSERSLYASIYPAVQNLLLAARALGIGSVLTTAHIAREKEIKALLGIPAAVETCALIPLGYPREKFAPTRRRAWREVSYLDHWGSPVD